MKFPPLIPRIPRNLPKILAKRCGRLLRRMVDFPVNLVLSPAVFAAGFVGSAPRGYHVPELISKISSSAVFVVAALGTCDIAAEIGKKVLCQRDCATCNGWNALHCTTCKGSGKVQYHVKSYTLKSGEKPTAGSVADAIAENRVELVHLPSIFDLQVPLPSKDCPTCDGSGVMRCPACKDTLQIRISADNIMEPPWKAEDVLRNMHYPYEHIADSMRDPSIATFWLITLPEITGRFKFNDEAKQRIWWEYKEFMRYDQLRDVVAKRKPGWEYLQEALISIDPARARNDPVVVKNIPYYKAKNALEVEVMKLAPPPRPENWGELNLPLNASSWSEDDLKDPKKLYEMTVLLNAQREIADKILDAQWETKWHQEKLNRMLEEKVRPYIQNMDNVVLPQPFIMPSQDNQDHENMDSGFYSKPVYDYIENIIHPHQPISIEYDYIQNTDNGVHPQPISMKVQENQDNKGKRRRWWLF